LSIANNASGSPNNAQLNDINLNNILNYTKSRLRAPVGSPVAAAPSVPEWAQAINAPIPPKPRGNQEPQTPQAGGPAHVGPRNSSSSSSSSGHQRVNSNSDTSRSPSRSHLPSPYVPSHNRNASSASGSSSFQGFSPSSSQSSSRSSSPMHIDSQGGSRQTSPTPARSRASSSLNAILKASPEKRDKGKGQADNHPSKKGEGSSGRRRSSSSSSSSTAA
jgi:hypothetical protein